MAGSRSVNEPRLIREILGNYLENSNDPLAVAYREYLFKDIYPNTELGIDLKLLTREPGRMEIGAFLDGVITHDAEDHFTFIQNAGEKKVDSSRRNPHVYDGTRINVIRKEDGTLYPTFNRPHYTEDFSFLDFCREAADELYMMAGFFTQFSGLVEEGGSR